MTEHDDELRDLLTDAVADVEPEYRLDAIRARTQRPHRRRGWYAAGGAILAAATVVTAVNLAQDDGGRRDHVPSAGQPEHTAALYFIDNSAVDTRLYREFQSVSGGPLADLEAMTREGGAHDPNYSTLWPIGIFTSVDVRDDVIEIGLGEWAGPDYDLSQDVIDASIQQVVYTAQAATGAELPVQFTKDGEPTADVFLTILPNDQPVQREAQNDALVPVSISDPAEGAVVTGDSFVARGRANSFEATVPWQITTEQGVVKEGFATAKGYGDHLFPWEAEVDISGLNPGHYTFVVMTDDPSGGEGPGPFTDTRTIIVE